MDPGSNRSGEPCPYHFGREIFSVRSKRIASGERMDTERTFPVNAEVDAYSGPLPGAYPFPRSGTGLALHR